MLHDKVKRRRLKTMVILSKQNQICFVEARQQGRFAGFSLYVSNTDVIEKGEIQASSLCYKDGPNLPSLNFTTNCIKQGRYVIFYNERIDNAAYPSGYELGNVFTELCNVVVHGKFENVNT